MKKFVYNENIDMLEIPADQFCFHPRKRHCTHGVDELNALLRH